MTQEKPNPAAENLAAATPVDVPASPSEVAVELSAEQQLTELQQKLSEMQDNFLRAKAEGENIRRRAEEEVSKARKFAVEAFAESLLPVMDSLHAYDADLGVIGEIPEGEEFDHVRLNATAITAFVAAGDPLAGVAGVWAWAESARPRTAAAMADLMCME